MWVWGESGEWGSVVRDRSPDVYTAEISVKFRQIGWSGALTLGARVLRLGQLFA